MAYVIFLVGIGLAAYGVKSSMEHSTQIDILENESVCDDLDQLYKSTFRRRVVDCLFRPLMIGCAFLAGMPYVSSIFITVDSTRTIQSHVLHPILFTQLTLGCFTAVFKPFWAVFALSCLVTFNMTYFMYEATSNSYVKFGVEENFSL